MERYKIERAKIHMFDVEELACKILGIDYDEIDADTEIIEHELDDQLNIDLDTFYDLMTRLLPLVEVAKSPITEITYKGFVDMKKGIWLLKDTVK
jgi:Mn-dependent DtxR family transcriptional regulator